MTDMYESFGGDHARRLPEFQKKVLDLLQEIATNTKPLADAPLFTKRRIFKNEAIGLLGISERSYERHKALGVLLPRGLGEDFFYPEDLEQAMAESKRRGRT